MKISTICTAIVLAGAGIVQAQDTASRQKLDLPKPNCLVMSKGLPENGTLVMEVNVGEVRVVRSDELKTIRLTIEPHGFYDDATVQSWIKRFGVAGDRASIDLKLPKNEDNHQGASVTVSVPAQTDLKLELGVGDLSVKGIEGNKELHVGIGDLTVGVTDSAKYNDIRTGTKIGDAEDAVSHQRSDGFFPKTHHTSAQGMYKLHATVGIGDVNVVQD
ncbi:hypothetical protein H7849_17715 [Alloacidobacterium dinghuense]|uniref:Adhesin domain-containing protein n=1 Tax=Alloacidobacterium dinghuense TaxID=2763107 RepID=A0A7G8BEG8_9BACT|nr:hypothetical protein [Alloacidobacterium dinghuense]QNI30938.1 hypothetical protein H7849_17715 [Alloacidobacterium dinghuense]